MKLEFITATYEDYGKPYNVLWWHKIYPSRGRTRFDFKKIWPLYIW